MEKMDGDFPPFETMGGFPIEHRDFPIEHVGELRGSNYLGQNHGG